MQENLNQFYLICTSMSHATRGEKTLYHLYSSHRDAYKALPHPPFGKSDHNSILLIPNCKQKLKQEVPLTRSIWKWSDDATAMLQDCFPCTDGICSGIHPMALRSIPPQSPASSCREEVRDLAVWCQDNLLSLHVSKTKEMIVDYRKRRAKHTPGL